MSEGSARHNVILLMDYSGYNQIVITPEDQEKTIFTFPFGIFACRRMINTFLDYVENGISSDKCLGNIILVLK